jgi:hypothetical protein
LASSIRISKTCNTRFNKYPFFLSFLFFLFFLFRSFSLSFLSFSLHWGFALPRLSMYSLKSCVAPSMQAVLHFQRSLRSGSLPPATRPNRSEQRSRHRVFARCVALSATWKSSFGFFCSVLASCERGEGIADGRSTSRPSDPKNR